MFPRIVLAALAALVAAAPAAASSPPYVPVDEGQVEHRVRTMRAEASYTANGAVPRFVRTEEWIARNRYHQQITDAQTGELIGETTQHGSRVATWDREQGLWTGEGPVRDGQIRLLGHSFATEAAMQRAQIDMGWYTQIGQAADSLTFESDPDAPSDGDNTTTLVLRRSDFTVLRRETVSRLENGDWFRQTEQTELAETLSAAPLGAFAAVKAKLVKARTAKKARRASKRSGRRG